MANKASLWWHAVRAWSPHRCCGALLWHGRETVPQPSLRGNDSSHRSEKCLKALDFHLRGNDC